MTHTCLEGKSDIFIQFLTLVGVLVGWVIGLVVSYYWIF